MITFPLLLSVIAKMQNTICAFLLSCPVRGTWIEMLYPARMAALVPRRAPYGARGLKSNQQRRKTACSARRAPYGARGLKFQCLVALLLVLRRASYGGKS